ncbi:TPA: hypothetical protein EYP66_16975 [Candidatus Poribacteria bacterium]|nr:hypothetical protein [Candidatus Poribacteria bacterium]
MKKEEILSQEEIDALMEAFSQKTPEDKAINETEITDESELRLSALPRYPRQEKDEIENKVCPRAKRRDGFLDRIDKNGERLKKRSERISQLLNHSLVSSLSNLLRRDVVLNNSAVEQPLTYEDFLASMNNPSCIGVLISEMSEITVLLKLDLSLAYSIIDITLGGKGDGYLKVQRALTDLELKLMEKPMERILEILDKTLNLKLRLEEVFTYPSQISINSSHEVVVPFAFDIMLKEFITEYETTSSKPTHTITFCLPIMAMESQLSNQNSAGVDLKKKDKYLEAIQKSILIDVPLRLQAHFPKTEITIGKLMEMKIGDTIVLGMNQDDDVIEVELLVEGCPIFNGKLGAIGRYKAVEII